jgi:hypothetical protein
MTNKNQSDRHADLLTTVVAWAVVGYAVIFMLNVQSTPAATCVTSKRVASIAELRYRDAVIVLEDGSNVTVNQAVLKPGDQYCTQWTK